ncbi:hypothetical protein [Aporhodopirellula aestuarii]|uniref:TFIIB-type zinc ribbon-containing protein n=1 Tax=Aporhodopirellula aestuarii TaxID=2950107 RepID=A0ABT0UB93_9BACT|nr:hypothetical protein [Aporhodopirellula aestuarii]MCM2374087.1 hypothetical protein [Aporhodopirellula aestuarii]
MYQLTCPHCETANQVSTAKAGGQIECSACQGTIQVPKLGELRSLPTAEPSPQERAASTAAGLSGGRSMAFAALGLVCLLSLLGAAFCGVNWSNIEVPLTTERHLEMLEESYAQANAAQMIREFEDITKYGVDIPNPLEYRTIEMRKQAWGQKTMAFAVAALVAFLLALFVGRKPRTAA